MASELRNMVAQMKPNSENKAFKDAQYTYMAIRESGGSPQVLVGTCQPSFMLSVAKHFASEEAQEQSGAVYDIEPDNELVWRVPTLALDSALAAFGTETADIRLDESILLESEDQQQAVSISAEPTEMNFFGELPATPREDDGEGLPCVESQRLLKALALALETAKVKGNDMEKNGVHIGLSPEGLCIEGSSPLSLAAARYGREVWLWDHDKTCDVVLSTDTARHLVAVLKAFGDEHTILYSLSDGRFVLRGSRFFLAANEQPVQYATHPDLYGHDYEHAFRCDRACLLAMLRGLKALGETHAVLGFRDRKCLLTDADRNRAAGLMEIDVEPKLDGDFVESLRYSIDPLIAALAAASPRPEVVLRTEDGYPLKMELGDIEFYEKAE